MPNFIILMGINGEPDKKRNLLDACLVTQLSPLTISVNMTCENKMTPKTQLWFFRTVLGPFLVVSLPVIRTTEKKTKEKRKQKKRKHQVTCTFIRFVWNLTFCSSHHRVLLFVTDYKTIEKDGHQSVTDEACWLPSAKNNRINGVVPSASCLRQVTSCRRSTPCDMMPLEPSCNVLKRKCWSLCVVSIFSKFRHVESMHTYIMLAWLWLSFSNRYTFLSGSLDVKQSAKFLVYSSLSLCAMFY